MDLDVFFTNTGLHHIGLEVIRHLDEYSLASCRLVSQSWCELITESRAWACGSLDLLWNKTWRKVCRGNQNGGIAPEETDFLYEVLKLWTPFRDLVKKNQKIAVVWKFARFFNDNIKPHPPIIRSIHNYVNFQLIIGLERLMQNGDSALVILILEWLKKTKIIFTHLVGMNERELVDSETSTSAWALVNGTLIGLRNITHMILTDPLMEGINVNYNHLGTPVLVSASTFAAVTKGVSKATILQELIADPSIEVNAIKDVEFVTALHHSVGNLDVEAVKLLLSVPSIDVNVRDAEGRTPLHVALQLAKPKDFESVPSKPRVISILLDHPNIDINSVDANGNTLLMYALLFGFDNLNERLNCVSALLQAGINIYATNNSGSSAIEIACRLGKIEEFKLLYNYDNKILSTDTSNGQSLLYVAVKEIQEAKMGKLSVQTSGFLIRTRGLKGLFQIVEFYIDNDSFIVNAKDINGMTPIHYALNQPDTAVLECLLKSKYIDVNARNNMDQTPILIAVSINDLAKTRLLLSVPNIDVNAKDDYGMTPLHYALNQPDTAVLECLLKSEYIDVNAQNNMGQTPLHITVSNQDYTKTQLLLSMPNINVNVKDRDSFGLTTGLTPLQTALRLLEPTDPSVVSFKPFLISILLHHPNIDRNTVDTKGNTLLMYALISGYGNPVYSLLEAGVNVYATNNSGQSAIELACRLGKLEEFQLLYNYANDTIYTRTSCSQKKSLLHLVIEEIYEIKKVNSSVEATYGLFQILEFLINTESFDVNVADANGLTPLHYSLNQPDTQVMEYLLQRKGIEVNTLNNIGQTPLHIVVSNQDLAKTRLLLQHEKIDVNAVALVSGETPLHIASYKQGAEVLKILLEVPNLIRDPLDGLGRTPSNNCLDNDWLEGYALLTGVSHLLQDFLNRYQQHYDVTLLFNENQVSSWCELFLKYVNNL